MDWSGKKASRRYNALLPPPLENDWIKKEILGWSGDKSLGFHSSWELTEVEKK